MLKVLLRGRRAAALRFEIAAVSSRGNDRAEVNSASPLRTAHSLPDVGHSEGGKGRILDILYRHLQTTVHDEFNQA